MKELKQKTGSGTIQVDCPDGKRIRLLMVSGEYDNTAIGDDAILLLFTVQGTGVTIQSPVMTFNDGNFLFAVGLQVNPPSQSVVDPATGVVTLNGQNRNLMAPLPDFSSNVPIQVSASGANTATVAGVSVFYEEWDDPQLTARPLANKVRPRRG